GVLGGFLGLVVVGILLIDSLDLALEDAPGWLHGLAALGGLQGFLVLGQSNGEGGGAGEEPLFQRLENEVRGELLSAFRGPAVAYPGILPQGGVDALLLVRVWYF